MPKKEELPTPDLTGRWAKIAEYKPIRHFPKYADAEEIRRQQVAAFRRKPEGVPRILPDGMPRSAREALALHPGVRDLQRTALYFYPVNARTGRGYMILRVGGRTCGPSFARCQWIYPAGHKKQFTQCIRSRFDPRWCSQHGGAQPRYELEQKVERFKRMEEQAVQDYAPSPEFLGMIARHADSPEIGRLSAEINVLKATLDCVIMGKSPQELASKENVFKIKILTDSITKAMKAKTEIETALFYTATPQAFGRVVEDMGAFVVQEYASLVEGLDENDPNLPQILQNIQSSYHRFVAFVEQYNGRLRLDNPAQRRLSAPPDTIDAEFSDDERGVLFA